MTAAHPIGTAITSLILPPGTRLLHIGPPKTGTSTLQGAFHRCRAETLAQGVRYAGNTRHSGSAVLAVTGRPSFGRDEGPPPIRKWQSLLRDVRRAAEPRVLVSSEFFADAEPPVIGRVLDELDRDRVHVVVTLRRLDRIIPSQWQQYVQSAARLAWGPWLERTLNDPPGPSPSFWRRHRHDALVERWAAEIGRDRVTVVVLDDRDPDHVLRVFESLLGLVPGTLVADEATANRSMTLPEIEAVRAYNAAFFAAGLGQALFHRSMHFGAAAYMRTRTPEPGEPRILPPRWAVERLAEISGEMVDGLRRSGVRVLGDLDALLAPPDGPSEVGDARVCITPEIAAAMATGVALVAGLGRATVAAGKGDKGSSALEERAELGRYATYQLVGAILGRLRRPIGRWVEALAGVASPRTMVSAPAAGPGAPVDPAVGDALAARFRSEGLVSPGADQLRERAMALAARRARTAGAAGGSDQHASAIGCIPPELAAGLGLGVLEAADIVRFDGEGPKGPRLRRVLWSWLEPPRLASIHSRRIVLAIAGRLLRRT